VAYKLYTTAQGQFAIDWDTCCQIIRSSHRSRSQLDNASSKTESQSSLCNPLSYGLPDLTTLEVDWDAVRRTTQSKTLLDAYRLGAIAEFDRNGVTRLVQELQSMQAETRSANDRFSGWQHAVSDRSLAAMRDSEKGYQSLIDGAKLIRDLSGSVLIGAATFATGGATGAALVGGGLGTALKTTAKYQDTGSLGIAAIEAAQNIVLCVLPAARGAKLAGGEKIVKLILGATLDTDKALLDGRELTTAIEEGVAGSVVSALGDQVLGKGLPLILDRVAVPVVARLLEQPTKVVSDGLTAVLKKTIEDRTKKAVQGAIKASAGADAGHLTHAVNRSGPDSNSWDTVMSFADRDELLLKFAVIDMAKGVGQSGW
jgi:hypothetical protein